MPLPDTSTLALYMISAMVLLLTPGPAVLYIVARSIDQGRLAGVVSALGIGVGSLFHITAPRSASRRYWLRPRWPSAPSSTWVRPTWFSWASGGFSLRPLARGYRPLRSPGGCLRCLSMVSSSTC